MLAQRGMSRVSSPSLTESKRDSRNRTAIAAPKVCTNAMTKENSPKRKPKSGRVFPGPHHLRKGISIVTSIRQEEDPLGEHLAREFKNNICDVETARKGRHCQSWNLEPKASPIKPDSRGEEDVVVVAL